MDDVLTFDSASGAFEQNTTAFDFQLCQPNWVDWRGEYELAGAASLLMSYMRCTPSGQGCLSCEPTRDESVGLAFSADCETLTLTYEIGVPRTYFPAKVAEHAELLEA